MSEIHGATRVAGLARASEPESSTHTTPATPRPEAPGAHEPTLRDGGPYAKDGKFFDACDREVSEDVYKTLKVFKDFFGARGKTMSQVCPTPPASGNGVGVRPRG